MTSTNNAKSSNDMELHEMMEESLQDYYKALAELKMERPDASRLTEEMKRELDQRVLYQLFVKANSSLRDSTNQDTTIESYCERFRHFVHLFFADEKLEFESKFKENVQVRYIEHRIAEKKGKGRNSFKYGSCFAIYMFSLPAQSLEDLVLYQAISIDNNKGKITKIDKDKNEIEVAFEDRKGTFKFDESISYLMDVEFNERQYNAWMRSVVLLERHGHANFAVFPDSRNLEMPLEEYQLKLKNYEKHAKNDPSFSEFDKQQRRAIFSVVNGVHETVPYLIWGPPGTGKTVTIVECVRQLLLKDQNNRILICTPSNMAADLIARRILKKQILSPEKMRRYYSLGKNVNDRDRALDTIIKIENCAQYGTMDDRFKLDKFEEMKQFRLIFSTLSCSSYFEEEIRGNTDFFSHIFIDEAGQSLEPETLIPLTRYATTNTRIILCGDHQQLGAVVKAHFLKQFRSCHSSLMERLLTNKSGVYADGRTLCQLTDSYRCHPAIIQFSSQYFYEGNLKAVNGANRSSFCKWKHLPKKGFPIIFHAIRKGSEVRQLDGRSFHNQEEVEVVLKYIDLLKKTMDIKDSEIGVISPYKKQTHKIRDCLFKNRGITVDSVECYQGSERRVIILTLARSKEIGFLSEYKRLNTSLTRAKELLIVVASLDFVRNLSTKSRQNYWTPFIEYCCENEAILLDEFAGEDGKEIDSAKMKRNIEEVRRCVKENTYKQTTHIERKKKSDKETTSPFIIQKKKNFAPVDSKAGSEYYSPFLRALVERNGEMDKWKNWRQNEELNDSRTDSSSEYEDEHDEEREEEAISDLSSLSEDEKGQEFWAKEIPWRKKEVKRGSRPTQQEKKDEQQYWDIPNNAKQWEEMEEEKVPTTSMVNCVMSYDPFEEYEYGSPMDDERLNDYDGSDDEESEELREWLEKLKYEPTTSMTNHGTSRDAVFEYERTMDEMDERMFLNGEFPGDKRYEELMKRVDEGQRAESERSIVEWLKRERELCGGELPVEELEKQMEKLEMTKQNVSKSSTDNGGRKKAIRQDIRTESEKCEKTCSSHVVAQASSSSELAKKRLSDRSLVYPTAGPSTSKVQRIPEEVVHDTNGEATMERPSGNPKKPRKSIMATEIADPCVENGMEVTEEADEGDNKKDSNCRIA